MKRLILISALLVASVSGSAAGMYAGFDAGRTSGGNSDSSGSGGFNLGYRYNENLAAQVEWYGFDANPFSTLFSQTGVYRADEHLGLAVVAHAPINEQFGLFGKLGLGRTEQIGHKVANRTVSEATLALGARWQFSQRAALKLQGSRYLKSKTNTATVGMDFSF